MRFAEPVEIMANLFLLDFDMITGPLNVAPMENALTTWQPSATPRIQAIPPSEQDPINFVNIFHPGIPVDGDYSTTPQALSDLIVRIDAMMERSYLSITRQQQVSLYVYDTTNVAQDPTFLGAGKRNPRENVAVMGPITFYREV